MRIIHFRSTATACCTGKLHNLTTLSDITSSPHFEYLLNKHSLLDRGLLPALVAAKVNSSLHVLTLLLITLLDTHRFFWQRTF